MSDQKLCEIATNEFQRNVTQQNVTLCFVCFCEKEAEDQASEFKKLSELFTSFHGMTQSLKVTIN